MYATTCVVHIPFPHCRVTQQQTPGGPDIRYEFQEDYCTGPGRAVQNKKRAPVRFRTGARLNLNQTSLTGSL